MAATVHSQTLTVLSLRDDTTNPPVEEAKYEEIVQSSDLFWEKFKALHHSSFAIPTVAGKALDLHRLFVEVSSRGGIEKVISDRKWKEVIEVFNFPSTITSASFVLRKFYMSLLHNFERFYYFQNQLPSDENQNFASGSAYIAVGDTENHLPVRDAENQTTETGDLLSGIIDSKFDNGYFVSMDLGSVKVRGILYHVPSASNGSGKTALSTRRRRKRLRLALQDPSRPKSNRSGYNFFFAEHYSRLKPMHHGRERVISKKIGYLWNNLGDAEKQVYQEKGMVDKERYKNEMVEYRSSQQ